MFYSAPCAIFVLANLLLVSHCYKTEPVLTGSTSIISTVSQTCKDKIQKMDVTLTKLKASIDSNNYEYDQLQVSLHSTYLAAQAYYTKQHELVTNALKSKSSYQDPEMPQDFEQNLRVMENSSIRLEAYIKILNQEYLDLQESRDTAFQQFQNSLDMANTLTQSRAADNIARMKQALEARRSKTSSLGGV